MEMSLQDRLVIATRIYSAVDRHFAHWQGVPDVDFDALFASYLGRISSCADRKAFAIDSMHLLAGLRNGHTDFFDQWLWTERNHSFGFYASWIGSQWVVIHSLNPAIKRGDEVLSIEGELVEDFYSRNRSSLSASTDRAARTYLFARRYLFPEEFTATFRHAGEVRCRRGAFSPIRPPETRSLPTLRDESGIGVLKIPSFESEDAERVAIELLHTVGNREALIVDVRGNGGGSTPVGLIEALMDRPYRMWTEVTNFEVSAQAASQSFDYPGSSRDRLAQPQISWPSPLVQPVDGAFAGRLVVLIDEYSHSATEDFLLPLSQGGRSILVGSATAGSSGQPFFDSPLAGITFRVGAKRQIFPDGRQFEGVGFDPDIRRPRTVEDIVDGTDRTLEAALETARP